METLKITRPAPGVAQVTMARPAVFNAFNEPMIDELEAAFKQLGQADDVRVIVLAGEGKAFSAGADLQWMQRASQASFEQNLADGRRFAGMFNTIDTCPKPTVARVQGVALGGAWAWPVCAISPSLLKRRASRSLRPSLASCRRLSAPM